MGTLTTTNIFGQQKQYLVNDAYKKILKVGFDYVDLFTGDKVIYRINGNYGVVDLLNAQLNDHKSYYKDKAIYQIKLNADGFTVLQDMTQDRIAIIDYDTGETKEIPGHLIGKYPRYFVYQVRGIDGSFAAFHSNEKGLVTYQIPKLDVDNPAFYNIENLNKFVDYTLPSRKDVKNLLKFYKVILEEDIRNYDRFTSKYVMLHGNQLVKDLYAAPGVTYPFRLTYQTYQFSCLEDAVTNANNILTYTKNMFLQEIEKQEKENKRKQDFKEDIELRKRKNELLEQKAIEEACKKVNVDI